MVRPVAEVGEIVAPSCVFCEVDCEPRMFPAASVMVGVYSFSATCMLSRGAPSVRASTASSAVENRPRSSWFSLYFPTPARRTRPRRQPELRSRLFARLDPRPNQQAQRLRLLQRIDRVVADGSRMSNRAASNKSARSDRARVSDNQSAVRAIRARFANAALCRR